MSFEETTNKKIDAALRKVFSSCRVATTWPQNSDENPTIYVTVTNPRDGSNFHFDQVVAALKLFVAKDVELIKFNRKCSSLGSDVFSSPSKISAACPTCTFFIRFRSKSLLIKRKTKPASWASSDGETEITDIF